MYIVCDVSVDACTAVPMNRNDRLGLEFPPTN